MLNNQESERAAAVFILSDVTDNAAYANISLQKNLSLEFKLDQRGKAFVTEIVYGALRNLIWIDRVIDSFSQIPVSKMKPYIRALLRVSVYQIKFMDRVPDHAAVNEAVLLAKTRGYGKLSGFVNGILRNIIRNPSKPAPLKITGGKRKFAEYLSIKFSYPGWLSELLIENLGAERASDFCAESGEAAQVSIFVNLNKTTPEELAEKLRGEGVDCEPGLLHGECLRLHGGADLTALASYRGGLFHVIDEGAVVAAKLLMQNNPKSVLDLCAAPGGKSFACASLAKERISIRAFDFHKHKINLMNESIKRLGINCIETKLNDAERINEAYLNTADAVLLDVPCSGFGTVRRRPEIKYARKPGDIKALAAKQRAMLAAAAGYSKPGGTLLYCTCTVLDEENSENINWFVNNYSYSIETPGQIPSGANAFLTENGCLQLMPSKAHDGFFIARLIKNEK